MLPFETQKKINMASNAGRTQTPNMERTGDEDELFPHRKRWKGIGKGTFGTTHSDLKRKDTRTSNVTSSTA